MITSRVLVAGGILVATVAAAVLAWRAPVLAQSGRAVTKWEYKVVEPGREGIKEMEQTLNRAGDEGWECVSSVGGVNGGGDRVFTNFYFVLKRPKQ